MTLKQSTGNIRAPGGFFLIPDQFSAGQWRIKDFSKSGGHKGATIETEWTLICPTSVHNSLLGKVHI